MNYKITGGTVAPTEKKEYLLLYCGANIKEISSRLGHTQLATTNLYLHKPKAADEASADTFQCMFGGKTKAQQPNGYY